MHSGTVIAFKSENKRAIRYKLRLPVIFRWGDEEDYVAGGFTRDIAQNAAYVLSNKCPPVGSVVRIEVLVPLFDSFPAALHIEGIGKVTELIEDKGSSGFVFHGSFDDDRIRYEGV
jgi:hypothetical protein